MGTSRKTARVVQINVNPLGGVPKHAIARTEVTINGVVGDKQRDRRHHGGLERAVSLYSYEHIQALQSEGHIIVPGATGENLTISGLEWTALQLGDRLRIGDRLRLEITGYATPCANIAECFVDGAIQRVAQKVNPGWSRLYARVLSEGPVAEGDAIEWDVGE